MLTLYIVRVSFFTLTSYYPPFLILDDLHLSDLTQEEGQYYRLRGAERWHSLFWCIT